MAKIVVGAKGLGADVFRWNVRTIFGTNEWANVRTNVGATLEQFFRANVIRTIVVRTKVDKTSAVLYKCFKTNFAEAILVKANYFRTNVYRTNLSEHF